MYCVKCGQSMSCRVPDGDSRERDVCEGCGFIHYENPRSVVGTVPLLGDRIILCRRAIAPRRGYWTLPAGFLETGETTEEGAARETREEAGVEVQVGELFSVVNVVHVHHVYLFYLGIAQSHRLVPGIESLEARIVSASEVPWDEIAFPAVTYTLKRFFADRDAGCIASGRFRVHSTSLSTSFVE